MKRIAAVLFCLGVLLSSASVANAATIIASNLNSTQGSHSQESVTYWEASSFVTPAGGPYLITSVTVPISLESDPTDFSLRIYTDSAGLPGASLGTFTNSALPSPAFPFSFTTFTPTGAVILQPGTTYWLAANITTGSVRWAWTSDVPSTQEGLGIVTGTWVSSTNEGATWTPGGAVNPSIFQIEGTPVPEPGAMLLFGIGLVGLAVRRYAKR